MVWYIFSYPCLYNGHEVEDVDFVGQRRFISSVGEAKTWGRIIWTKIFKIEGTRRFWRKPQLAQITNINKITKKISFFDEKNRRFNPHGYRSIVPAKQAAKNESSVHWDMISDMTQGGENFLQTEKLFYRNGQFFDMKKCSKICGRKLFRKF